MDMKITYKESLKSHFINYMLYSFMRNDKFMLQTIRSINSYSYNLLKNENPIKTMIMHRKKKGSPNNGILK